MPESSVRECWEAMGLGGMAARPPASGAQGLLAGLRGRKGVDPAVAGVGIHRREDDEDVGLVAVGNPELAAVEDEAVAGSRGARRQGEGVAARARLGQGVGADGVLLAGGAGVRGGRCGDDASSR